MEALSAYLSERDNLRQVAQQVLDAAGVDQRAAEADMKQVRDWLNDQPLEVLLFAAESARGKKMPLRWMDAALRAWTGQGVRDAAGAKAARDAGKNRARPQPQEAPKPAAQSYNQRSYDDQFFDSFFVDLSKGGDAPC